MDLVFSFIYIALKVVFKETFKALAKRVMSRKKEKTAPNGSRDGRVNNQQ